MERLQGAGVLRLDRYAIFEEIASGGMASVHLGRLVGPAGFSRTVAIKRMHPHLAKQDEFVSMFLDEALLATRIRHPNVVTIIDIVSAPGELALVMEFIQGESLDRLLKSMRTRGERLPPSIVASIGSAMLHGLHAAHEASSEYGEPLGIVHRDVSPQNVMVGIDGVTRVADFGIAKARGRLQTTREGQLKGKLTYMSPEQALHEDVDRRTDIFAVGIVLWEMLVGRRLFDGVHEAAILSKILCDTVRAPSLFFEDLAPFDAVVMRALSRDAGQRYPTARAMLADLERVVPLATATDIGTWVERLAGDTIGRRTDRVRAVERIPFDSLPSSVPPPPMGLDETIRLLPSDPAIPRAPGVPQVASPTSDAMTRVDGKRGPVSQVSSISVTVGHPPEVPESSRGSTWWAWAIGAALSATVGGMAAFLLRGPTPAGGGGASEACERTLAVTAPESTAEPEPTTDPSVSGTDVNDLPSVDPRQGGARGGHGGGRPKPTTAPATAATATARGTSPAAPEKPTDYGF